jgi:hypothetical protein
MVFGERLEMRQAIDAAARNANPVETVVSGSASPAPTP